MTFRYYEVRSKQPEANRGLGQCDAFALGFFHLLGNVAWKVCHGI